MTTGTADEVRGRARQRVAELGAELDAQLAQVRDAMHKVLAGSIDELQGDGPILELLRVSIESNLETLVHIMRYDIPVGEVTSPAAAEEYARRLAQRGVSSNALVRAYRLGQQAVLDWAFGELARIEPDREVAFIAGHFFTDMTFRYVDSISEQVVLEYESERERWLANRNTVRAAMLKELIAGERVDLATAETALGYRLRQYHLGVVVWSVAPSASGSDLQHLEKLVGKLAKSLGATGQPMFISQDRTTGWGWIPLGRSPTEIQVADLCAAMDDVAPTLHAAVGTPGGSSPGFRDTHLEAIQARQVALVAQPSEPRRLTSYTEPGVRTAAMLSWDLHRTRRLVRGALGNLAADTESAARLRETLLLFLTEKGSYTATAELVHLHKNTVKYRVDKAVEERGRPLDDERLELELALTACAWLGSAVLSPAARD
jgi:hypothetical protein